MALQTKVGSKSFLLTGVDKRQKLKVKIPLGKATSTIEAFFGIGSMFGPSVGGLFYDLGGFKLPFFFLGGFSLLVSAASLLLFYEEEENENESNSDENINVSWLNILKSLPKDSFYFF